MKKIFKCLFIMVISFAFVIVAKAETASVATTKGTDRVIGMCTDAPCEGDYDSKTTPTISLKNIGTDDNGTNLGAALCYSGVTVAPPKGTCTYNETWSKGTESIGTAYIINLFMGEGGNTNKTTAENLNVATYYWTEMLTLGYLGNYPPSTLEEGRNFNTYNATFINDNYEILKKGSWSSIVNDAKSYALNAVSNVDITFDVENLTFTKSSDGYYYSQNFKYTYDDDIKVDSVNISNSKFSIVDGTVQGTQRLKIASSDIDLGGTESVNVKVKAYRDYYYAKKYDCGETVQSLILTQTFKDSKTGEKSISGTVNKPLVSIKIAKKDKSSSKFIAGATLMFQTEQQYNNDQDGTTYTSLTDYITISNLNQGTYYITEKEAPQGYARTDEVKRVVIDNEGNVTVNDVASSQKTIVVLNEKNQLNISKVDITNKEELPGAHLQILDENKNPIIDQSGQVMYSWVSEETPHLIEGIPNGTYYLEEITAPDGYEIAEMIKFEIKDGVPVTTVIMEDAPVVPVPDTGVANMTLAILGLIVVATGGILIYLNIRKRKLSSEV